MIEKNLHIIWIGTKPEPKIWTDTWRKLHPEWNHILWNNERVASEKWENQELMNKFAELEMWHGVADLLRYEILWRYGGAMPGADSQCIRPIDELFADDCEAYAVDTSTRGDVPAKEANRFSCAPLYASKKGGKLARILIDECAKMEHVGKPSLTVGNRLMRNVVREHPDLLKIWPMHYFIPIHYDGWRYKGEDKPFACHHWGSTLDIYGKEHESKLHV